MLTADDYLCIPKDYFQWLAFQSSKARKLTALNWSSSGEALDYGDGQTFALGAEIAIFIEGFATGRPLIPFVHLLHFLHLLEPGSYAPSDDLAELCSAFVKTGRLLRNAGTLAAHLCAAVSSCDERVDVEALCRHLSSAPLMVEASARQTMLRRKRPAPCPPLGPEKFEKKLREALKALSYEDIEHWFRHGRGSVEEAAKEIAREFAARPRSLSRALAALARRERLAGAVSLVGHLEGALTLPPRRLEHQPLAVGGYADVTTRGLPEHLLPHQFALDEMEFLRRFAEREMLYFRREEPHAPASEDLVVLLDQGVRTWGDVRMVLSAAVLALGKMAVRKKVPFRFAATSARGRVVDPLQEDDETIGEMLEASDLTPEPGLALERVLEDRAAGPRDVVMLTHPRNLSEENVIAAARRVSPGTRLFALAVDGHGTVSLSELRHGEPAKLKQFRVDIPGPATSEPKPETSPQNIGTYSAWQGDAEPVGFPFRFGIRGRLRACDFDWAGEWIAAATEGGLLYAWKLDDRRMEVLPRGMVDREPFRQVETVLGVAGGFVAVGYAGNRLAAAHYDFERRRLTVHVLGEPLSPPWYWRYSHEFHSVVAIFRQTASHRIGDWCRAVDLSTGERYPAEYIVESADSRVAQAVQACSATPGLVWNVPEWRFEEPGCSLYLDERTGVVKLNGVAFTPMADGRPLFVGGAPRGVQYRNDILAVAWSRPSQGVAIYLFRGPHGALIREYAGGPKALFALSSDGRFLARQIKSRQIAIDDVAAGGAPVFVTTKGKTHQALEFTFVGLDGLIVLAGRYFHYIRWTQGNLSFKKAPAHLITLPSGLMPRAESKILPELVSYDPKRFQNRVSSDVTVIGDDFGHLLVLDRSSGELVCMFFIFRGEIAAWMPDGTRCGPASLIGGPATPDAERRIGHALSEASRRYRERLA